MSKVKPVRHDITAAQRKSIFGLMKARGVRTEEVALHVQAIAGQTVEEGKTGISLLTFRDANELIVKLGGVPHASKSRRTVQRLKKMAGIETVPSERQLKFIADLASQRGWSAEGLRGFIRRQTGHDTPQTTKQANAVAEALKSMNRRDGLWAGEVRVSSRPSNGDSK
jgi:hypothetical protein